MTANNGCYLGGLPPDLLEQCFGVRDPSQIVAEAPCLQAAECLSRQPLGARLERPLLAEPGPQFTRPRDNAPASIPTIRPGHWVSKTYEFVDRVHDGGRVTQTLANFGFRDRWRITDNGNYSFTGSGAKRLMWRRSWYPPGSKWIARLAIGETFLKRIKWVQLVTIPVFYGVDYGLAVWDGDVAAEETARRALLYQIPKVVIGALVTAGVAALAVAATSVVIAPLAAGLIAGIVFDAFWDRWIDPDAHAIVQMSNAIQGSGTSGLMLP